MNHQSQPTNIFAMFQRNPNCHYPCVRIDFTQIKDNYQSNLKGQNVFKKIVPSYNNDKLYFTDAFVLQSQIGKKSHTSSQSLSNQPQQETKEKFESKVQKQNDNMEIQEIYQAEPDSFFCQICRAPFENYYQHIEHKDHIRNLQFSKGYKFIKQICKQAKKHLNPAETEQESSNIKSKQKIKTIRQKRSVNQNSKKNDKDLQKIRNLEQEPKVDQIQSLQDKNWQNSKIDKKEEFQSIINGQMKQSAVEKLNIQTQN